MLNKLNYLTAILLTAFVCLTACENSNDPLPNTSTSNKNSATVAPTENGVDALTLSNSLSELLTLPKDLGGKHTPYLLGTTSAKYGYYLYTPGGYESSTKLYPLLIFLHGKSESGDGSKSLTVLNRVLANGPPRLIKDGKWKPAYPMLVVSPQYHGGGSNLNNWGGGDPNNLKGFIEYMISKYRVDPKRIYLTGLSFGGNGVYDYISMTDDASNYIAAAAPIAAYGARKGYDKSNETPIWTFVGESDATNFNTSKSFVTTYNSQKPAPLYKAKISAYKGAGHDVWTRTYSGDGLGTADPSYDPFNQKLYDWMFQYKRK